MAEKVKTPMTKAATAGGAKAPAKTPAVEKIAAEQAEQKALLEQSAKDARVQKVVAEQAEQKKSTLDTLIEEQEGMEVPPWHQPAEEETEEPEGEQEDAEPTDAAKPDAMQAAVAAIGEKLQNAKAVKQEGDRSHLKCWHGIGEILHSYLGHKDRHPYGLKVVEEAARRFKIAESELHKAAKFFRLGPDFDAFCGEHEDLDTWSKVKAWLPREGEETEGQRTRRKHRALVARAQGCLRDLRKSLAAGLKASIAEGDLQDFATELKKTAKQILGLAETDKPTSDEPAEEVAT
jgi:hypothetical protein